VQKCLELLPQLVHVKDSQAERSRKKHGMHGLSFVRKGRYV
jgi:hypothetical protein